MIDIILHHHKYIPTLESTETFRESPSVDDQDEADGVPIDRTRFHKIVFGGDQLTTA